MKCGVCQTLILCSFLIPLHAFCGENGNLAKKGLGLTAGSISGIGIAYRQHSNNHMGAQIGGGFWVDDDDWHFNGVSLIYYF